MVDARFEAGAQPPADPAALTALFGALEAFNGSEDSGMRFGASVVDGLIKGNHKKDLVAQGMTPDEAVEHIKATEGVRSEAEEAVAWDHASLAEFHRDALAGFGLGITHDLLVDAHVEVRDGELLVAGLAGIHEDAVTDKIRGGLANMVRLSTGGLPWTIINNHQEEVVALDAWPYWMRGGAIPEPENHAVMLATLEHGEDIAAHLERLRVDPEQVARLHRITRYYNENMLVEWALATEMGCYDNPHDNNGGMPLYRQRHQPSWDWFWRMMDFADAKSMPGDTFVADLRDQMTAQLTSFLRAMLAGRLVLSKEADQAAWPDTTAMEARAAAEAEADQAIAQILQDRQRLQAYGRK